MDWTKPMLNEENTKTPSGTVEIYTDGACSGNPGPGGGVLSSAGVSMKKNCMVVKWKRRIIAWN